MGSLDTGASRKGATRYVSAVDTLIALRRELESVGSSTN
jgi:hypothetical protein